MEKHSIIQASSNELELIEFYIDELQADGTSYRGYYGMNVAKVLEIIHYPEVTAVPSKHHEAVLGTFNLRGRVLPLVDLSVWLGKTLSSRDNLKVLVSEFGGIVVAFLVSGVNRIHRLSWKQIEAPSAHVQNYSKQSITGIVHFEERILFILDVEKIISTMNSNIEIHKAPVVEKELTEDDVTAIEEANNYNILIVDDSTSIRNTIGFILENAGYNVTSATSGREAWDILTKWKAEIPDMKDHVHLVISDIEMPEMDGHTLTKSIKEDPALSEIPVVLFSALTTDAVKNKGVEVGANMQISKQELPILADRVRDIVSGKEADEENYL